MKKVIFGIIVGVAVISAGYVFYKFFYLPMRDPLTTLPKAVSEKWLMTKKDGTPTTPLAAILRKCKKTNEKIYIISASYGLESGSDYYDSKGAGLGNTEEFIDAGELRKPSFTGNLKEYTCIVLDAFPARYLENNGSKGPAPAGLR